MGVGELRIRGVVLRGEDPIEGAYVTLNSADTLIAERRTGPDGFYEFHITPGEWKLVCRAAGAVAITKLVRRPNPGEVVEDFLLKTVGQ
jgi:hypothetical protein